MYALWPMGGAWLCTHLWENYQYSLDKVRTSCANCYHLYFIDFPVLFCMDHLWLQAHFLINIILVHHFYVYSVQVLAHIFWIFPQIFIAQICNLLCSGILELSNLNSE